MKSMIRKSFIVLALIFLAACGQKPTDISTMEPPKTVEETIQFATDQKHYIDAVKFNTSALCELVQNQELKVSCGFMVSSSLTAEKAIAQNSLQLCKTVKSDAIRKGCEVQVNAQLDAAKKAEEDQKALLKAEENLDIEACEKLTEEYQRSQCLANVVPQIAKKESNPALCDKITLAEIRDMCKAFASPPTPRPEP